MASEIVHLIWTSALSDDFSAEPVRVGFANLVSEDALALTDKAIEALLESQTSSYFDEERVGSAFRLLNRIACVLPDVLARYRDRLLELNVLKEGDGVIFRQAGSGVRDRLIERAEGLGEGDREYGLLYALAWVDDEVVLSAFQRWAADPPLWGLALGAGIWRFSTGAGWTVGRDGLRRSLYWWACRRLSDGGANLAASVGGRFEDEVCPWCSNPLTVVLDLDLAHPGIEVPGIAGRRLRIPTCELCVCKTTLYLDIDLDGGARWSEFNQSLEYRLSPEVIPDGSLIPAGVRTLGAARRSPFAAMYDYGYDEVSQLGGLPSWVQGDDFPRCPTCGELMPFLGQVDTSVVAWGEGVIYAFIDVGCLTVATLYQQT